MIQIIIIILLVAADQLTKFLIWAPMATGSTVQIIPGILNFTKIKNEGASFGMLQGAQVFFIIMTVVVLVAAGFFMIKHRNKQSLYFRIVIAVVFAGALGNLIDRIAYGYVRDFIDFCFVDFWKYVFNIADAALVVGAILLCIYLLFFLKDKKAEETVAADGQVENKPNDGDKGE